jgi:hypothetical protein
MIATAAAIAALSTLSGDAKAAQRWCGQICANAAQSTETEPITLQGNARQERAEDAHRSLKSREEGQ